MMIKAPIIYDYLDYRDFLRDMYAFNKDQHKQYSYRFFANKAGFASPNYLKLVINNERNMTNESIAKVAKGFSLKKNEREFFENLVFMNQARTHDERNYYYQKMISLKGNTEIKRLDKASFEYYSKWYYPVIREIVVFGNRDLTEGQIAALLNPPLVVHEVEKAISVLVELGLIRKDQSGLWEQCDKFLSTGPEVQSLIVANYHREMLRIAAESIERFPVDKRDVTALTLSISNKTIPKMKERIAAFRKELLMIAGEDNDADQVVQINFQLFPVSRVCVKENS